LEIQVEQAAIFFSCIQLGAPSAFKPEGRFSKALYYRLRVAAVVRDYGLSERREQASADSRAIYDVSD